MPVDELVAVKAGLDTVKLLKALVVSNDKDYRLNDQLCKALRVLYFVPDGVVSLLNEIDRGEQPTPERLEKALPAFNDKEWEVIRALQSLDFRQLKHELKLTLATSRALDRVRDLKRNLRQEIQDEVNYYGRSGVRPNKSKVRRMIRNIQTLNSMIEDLERIINARAIERR